MRVVVTRIGPDGTMRCRMVDTVASGDASHEAMILWAMVALMACRLAQAAHQSDTHLAVLVSS